MHFVPGSLVSARGRDWVVQPESTADYLRLRPLTGSDVEATGILTALEEVRHASFPRPDAERVGDYRSCRLLRDALRLQIRNAAGPFRSLGKIAVEPRSYQLVPLLMALKLDPVRLLIADDVGIGKTVEAILVAKELLERGEANGLVVLCPPHLAEQWQRELYAKFHIDAELVLAGTASRLERKLRTGESLFERYPHTVVSLDFIKFDARRETFLRSAPNLVIVDEAHTCASGGGRHQRHALLRQLAAKEDQHLILVTATPHSGDQAAFHSLLALLDPTFAELPDDLTREEAGPHRKRLARHLVQRRRANIENFLEDTPFPAREGEREVTWQMSPGYRALFDKVLSYAREIVGEGEVRSRRARVHWWSALAALRSVGSSPAAAAATLRARAPHADAETVDGVDRVGEKLVLDLDESEGLDGMDLTPGAIDPDEGAPDAEHHRQRARLLALAREAEAFCGAGDTKLDAAVALAQQLVAQGRNPIFFCRFIPTAEYVAAAMKQHLGQVEIRAITGLMPPEVREDTIAAMGRHPQRLLVCTDCLSEGINLQDHFDTVVHYDLAWNPTRHEQREGRVDRYGQPKPTVRLLTLYGENSPIDGIVLDVLLRKHRTIRSALGVSIALPDESGKVIDALMEGLLLRTGNQKGDTLLPGMKEFLQPRREDLHRRWDAIADREKRSRTLFAQESLKPEDVRPELDAVRAAIGSRDLVRTFVTTALQAHGATVEQTTLNERSIVQAQLGDQLSHSLRTELRRHFGGASGNPAELLATFELPTPAGAVHLARTHPILETLANLTVDSALDPANDSSVGRRAGAVRTKAVEQRTVLCLLRLRFEIHEQRGSNARTLLLEEIQIRAFRGTPDRPQWLEPEATEVLLDADPSGNLNRDQAREAVQRVLDHAEALEQSLSAFAKHRADALLLAHRRVRQAARQTGIRQTIEWKPPLDWLGVYVLLPAGGL